jgi:folate-binding protein YgfZ
MDEQSGDFSPPHATLTPDDARTIHTTARAVEVPSGVFRVEGGGALTCVQGIFTNDVVKRAADALIWGAVLTPKGMIIFDMWVLRDDDAAWMIVPEASREAAAALFRRTFPPRIARVTDRTADIGVRWILGPSSHAQPERNVMALPAGPAPFAALVLGSGEIASARLCDAEPVGAQWADVARLLAGWPTLGREIDERTLPQEVRFDELDGVRYDKGCYTGQETVARLHFRGHANRTLRGLEWLDGAPDDGIVSHHDKPVGSISTWGRIGTRTLALAKIRREVADGSVVVAGRREARVVPLPFTHA